MSTKQHPPNTMGWWVRPLVTVTWLINVFVWSHTSWSWYVQENDSQQCVSQDSHVGNPACQYSPMAQHLSWPFWWRERYTDWWKALETGQSTGTLRARPLAGRVKLVNIDAWLQHRSHMCGQLKKWKRLPMARSGSSLAIWGFMWMISCSWPRTICLRRL